MSGHFRAEWLHGAGFQRFHNPPLLKTGSGGLPRDVAYCHINNSHGSFMRQLPVLRHGIRWLAAQTDASRTLRHSRVVSRSTLLLSFFSFSSFLWYPQAHPPPASSQLPPCTCDTYARLQQSQAPLRGRLRRRRLGKIWHGRGRPDLCLSCVQAIGTPVVLK